MSDILTREELDRLWKEYHEFCRYATRTREVKGISAPDFLGWLEGKLESKE